MAARPKEPVGPEPPPGGPTTARMAMAAITFTAATARMNPPTMKKWRPGRMSFLADGLWPRSVKLRFRRFPRRAVRRPFRKGQYGTGRLRSIGVARVRISVGKLRGLQQISDATGRFTMIAMDQRGSLQKMLHPENPKAATYAEMEAVKLGQSIADECRRLDLTFVCEPMSYPVDESEEAFAHHKADTVIRTAEALSPLGIDVLKAEFPGDPKVATSPEDLRKNCDRLSRATKVPWVVLSAGADFTVFRGLVEVACQGGASGFLAGRAIWKDAFREKTLAAQMEYVRTQGVRNFQALADLAHRHGRPWWDFYGGKEKLQDHFEGWYVKY